MTIPHPLHVQQDGPADAPVLLLIHGAGASTRSWDALVPLLTAAHRVVRVDLLGHGRSAGPPGPGYTVAEQADNVRAALADLGVGHAIVAGHSTGGAVATALAERHPGLVRALVLIDSGPSPDALIAPEITIGAQQWTALTDAQIRQAMRPAFGRDDHPIPQELVDDVRAVPHHAFTATMRAPRDYIGQRSLPARLCALGKPLLVLFGARDRRWRASSAADYAVVPGARIELLPDVGHSPMLEAPAATAAALLSFTAVRT